MLALKVRVKDGRIVVNEPTDLPDGAELEVVVIDDDLSPEPALPEKVAARMLRSRVEPLPGAFAGSGRRRSP